MTLIGHSFLFGKMEAWIRGKGGLFETTCLWLEVAFWPIYTPNNLNEISCKEDFLSASSASVTLISGDDSPSSYSKFILLIKDMDMTCGRVRNLWILIHILNQNKRLSHHVPRGQRQYHHWGSSCSEKRDSMSSWSSGNAIWICSIICIAFLLYFKYFFTKWPFCP